MSKCSITTAKEKIVGQRILQKKTMVVLSAESQTVS